jgi:hypothetical protein
MFTNGDKQSHKKYTCETCNVNTSNKKDYTKHLATRKHKLMTKCLPDIDIKKPKQFICVCGKEYSYRQSLYVHRKTCTPNNETDPPVQPPKEDIIEVLINENKDFKNIILNLVKTNTDLQTQMMEVCKNTNSHNTINSHNKTFNMQVFLNEKCKDAMNIMDFVNSMTLELSDLEDVGEVGYVEGISKIIIRKLNELDVCMRPIHCSDFKREIMYVKDMDVWSKENGTFDKIRKAIKYVTKKNSDLLIPWIQKYPTGMNIQHPHNDIYMRLMNQAMGGRESFLESENKIIKKISKAVQIDKTYKY